jgi:pimeloyl-ACP methyl ester carboxylesterase
MRIAGATLDVMGHSMGCRVSLLALQGKLLLPKMIRNIYLTAAAVDNESIEKDEEYYPYIESSFS